MEVLETLNLRMEQICRRMAAKTSRRGFFSYLGRLLVGAMLLPLLPMKRVGRAGAAESGSGSEHVPPPGLSRKEAFAQNAQTTDPKRCNYWRYCATDGFQCSHCGGGVTACPPGTEPAPSSWVGSCIHPEDGKEYLISYRDCCGSDSCGRGFCRDTIEETPTYLPQRSNDIIWCFGASNMVYHCSTASVIGEAT